MKNTPDLMQRGGRFKVSAPLLRSRPPELLDFMSQVLVVRAEHHFATDKIHYSGLSAHFEPVAEGLEYPEYKIEFDWPQCGCFCDCSKSPTLRVRKL